MGRVRQAISILLCIFLALLCIFVLFLPLPKVYCEREYYSCLWESGSQTRESYYAAYSSLAEISENCIHLQRGGLEGEISAGESYSEAYDILSRGELAELLKFRLGEVTRLEKAALFEKFGSRGYYAEEFFCWNGERFFRSKRMDFKEVFLLTGKLPKGLLSQTGAEKLIAAPAAEITAECLVGSEISSVEVSPPYLELEGGIYLETPGGRRLVAALPKVETLIITCDYLDEGALAACASLKFLKLPETYEGTISMLFGDSPIPEGLVCL